MSDATSRDGDDQPTVTCPRAVATLGAEAVQDALRANTAGSYKQLAERAFAQMEGLRFPSAELRAWNHLGKRLMEADCGDTQTATRFEETVAFVDKVGADNLPTLHVEGGGQ